MLEATTIGIDIAKSVFQIHGVNAVGEVVIAKRLTRGKVLGFFEKLSPCLVGIEACPTSHHWARALTKLGHDVRLFMPLYSTVDGSGHEFGTVEFARDISVELGPHLFDLADDDGRAELGRAGRRSDPAQHQVDQG